MFTVHLPPPLRHEGRLGRPGGWPSPGAGTACPGNRTSDQAAWLAGCPTRPPSLTGKRYVALDRKRQTLIVNRRLQACTDSAYERGTGIIVHASDGTTDRRSRSVTEHEVVRR